MTPASFTSPGTATLLMGEVGSGKTTSLISFIKAGITLGLPLKLAVIITEPKGVESLIDGLALYGIAKPEHRARLHYCYIPPATGQIDSIIEMATKIGRMSHQQLAATAPIARGENNQLMDVLNQMKDFVNQHGESLGPFNELDSSWMFAIDSLSGVNTMTRRLHIGLKPTMHQGEWQACMNLEESLVNELAASCQCFFTLTCHVDKSTDELTGKTEYVPNFLGSKLGPHAPKIFSDVILQYREEKTFRWSTTRPSYKSLKARAVEHNDKLDPTFLQVVNSWMRRQKSLEQDKEWRETQKTPVEVTS